MRKKEAVADNYQAAVANHGFNKQQFLRSEQFDAHQKDVLNALLNDGETYTVDQVVKMIAQFMKREVSV